MSEREAFVYLKSNNQEVTKLLLENDDSVDIKFTEKISSSQYALFLIDVVGNLQKISQNIITIYAECREKNLKLAVVVLHPNNIDIEKNYYFQKMLTELGKSDPIHRLIFTKDLYQYTQIKSSTLFDKIIRESISSSRINISKKGEDLYYPLTFGDFIKAITKILFLSHTEGKTFWILGDPIKDLELAYLLKKRNQAINNKEFEINALNSSDQKTNSLNSFSTKARAELNWNPEEEINNTIKKIGNEKEELEERVLPTNKKNKIILKFQSLYKRLKPKKQKERLPKISIILRKIIYFAVGIYAISIIVFVLATALSLKELESSAKHIQLGNLQSSTNHLKASEYTAQIGDSALVLNKQMLNIVSPIYSQKISNLYSFLNYSQISLKNIHQTYNLAENLRLSLNTSDNNISYKNVSLALNSNLNQVYENLNQISLLVSEGKLPLFLEKKLKNNLLFRNISVLEEQITQYIKIIDIFPEILSDSKSVNIVVLFQNSNILSAIGGKLDFLMSLTISKGNLVSSTIYTPTEIDEKYIATPSAKINNKNNNSTPTINLNKILTEPDFPTASNQLANYLENSIKIKPDFIVATNETLIDKLIAKTDTVDKESFETNYQGESGLEIYKEEINIWLTKLFAHEISLPVIGRTIAEMISENQFLVWALDQSTEKLISTQTYSGAIYLSSCLAGIFGKENCIAETSYLVEQQIPNDRKSLWSARDIIHDISIKEFSIDHEFQINYITAQPSEENEDVSVIYHLFLPTSSLNQFILDNLPYSTKEVFKTNERGLDHYEIPININIHKNHLLTIRLTTSQNSNHSFPLSYSITEYRQPGLKDLGTNLVINHPSNTRPTVVTEPISSGPSSVSLTLPRHTTAFGLILETKTQ